MTILEIMIIKAQLIMMIMTLLEGFFILNGEPSPCIKKWADVFTQSIIAAY